MKSITTNSGLELSFELLKFEDESAKFGKNDGIHLNIYVELKADGFSGHSNFWARKYDWDFFIDELRKFNKNLSGEAKINCGWGETTYFGIEFFTYNNAGLLGVKINVAEHIAGRSKEENPMNRVIIEKELEPNEVEKFIKVFSIN